MSDDGEKTCPLCTEEMDLTDQQLKPCKCGYEICVWCWHHIMDMAEKDETEGRCPACRSSYDKEKIVGMAASCERLVAEINSDRKLKSQKSKPKTSEGRKHLSSVRVIQRNLVYIIGIPSNLADEDLLQHKEYFGQYGKVLKVSISRTAGGVIQHSANNTCSVYITYSKEEEAIRCIQSVHGFILEGRPLRACFGTTKYCHAWLRNVPCTNPDCLYLHDIGTQEDSFTKDEIISAYTRSRVQQITGATYNLQRRSGNVLPPPADDYCNGSATSSSKPIIKSTPTNPVSQVKGSPPDGSSGTSITLPAAASWGMRVTNGRPPAPGLVSPTGPARQKLDAFDGVSVLPPVVTNTTQTSALHNDLGKKSMGMEETHSTHSIGRSEALDISEQYVQRDSHGSVMDKLVDVQETTPSTHNDHLSSSTSKDKNKGNVVAMDEQDSIDLDRQFSNSTSAKEDESGATSASMQNLCSGLLSMKIESNPGMISDAVRSNSSVSDNTEFRFSGNHALESHYDQFREPLTMQTSRTAATLFDSWSGSDEKPDWRLDSRAQLLPDVGSKVEEDLIALGSQRLNVLEAVSSSYLPSSNNPPKSINQYTGSSWQQSETSSSSNHCNADVTRTVNSRADESYIPVRFSGSVLSNGCNVNKFGIPIENSMVEHSNIFSSIESESFSRSKTDIGKKAALHMGESSIISNILSMDFDPWNDSLTAPHNLVKLLSEPDKENGSLQTSNSWKAQNGNQSRFSFARQTDFANEGADMEPSFDAAGYKKYIVPQSSVENRDHILDKLRNGFSSDVFEESDCHSSNHSTVSSRKLSAFRAQVSVPPGFTVPSRAPPPGFSSQERMDLSFEATPGNHLLESSSIRNQFQVPPMGNISSSIGDVEFIDPAILAVGKGRLLNGMNGSGLDMRPGFSPQVSAENDARLQLLMQQSISTHQMQQPISTHQNVRFANHIGDRFPWNDAYNSIPSRHHFEQPQASNLTPYAQLSIQQSRNARFPNGHWDAWNEVQATNDLGMAEILRNERLGFNKFYPGYEDLKFRMPNSADIYNRAFGM